MRRRAFNLPNLLTYGRILAVPLILLCFYLEGRTHPTDFARWTALAIYVIASITDYLDVIAADRAELQARLASLQTGSQRLNAVVQLIKALGGGWSEKQLVAVR